MNNELTKDNKSDEVYTATGIVVEYNPFHNGHLYHLNKSKEMTNCSTVIAVMSSDFLQRGEPAILDKWKRTEIALKNGVDIVIELPTYYSNQSAEIFAYGSVSLLDKLKVTNLVFGSESGKIESFQVIVKGMDEFKSEINEKTKEYLETGLSYPIALGNAISEILKTENIYTPNNILGIEYVKTLMELDSKITPLTIKRKNAGYHDTSITSSIASATAIRAALIKHDSSNIVKSVPQSTYEHLELILTSNKMLQLKDYYNLIRYNIIMNKDTLSQIQDIEFGFENRLYQCAVNYSTFKDFFENLKTKRYTYSRVHRILTHILLGLTTEITSLVKNQPPPYIRILGFNKTGQKYLSSIKKHLDIPIITNIKGIEEKLDNRALKLFHFEQKASQIYRLISKTEDRKIPVII